MRGEYDIGFELIIDEEDKMHSVLFENQLRTFEIVTTPIYADIHSLAISILIGSKCFYLYALHASTTEMVVCNDILQRTLRILTVFCGGYRKFVRESFIFTAACNKCNK